jgi:hypothetical protein
VVSSLKGLKFPTFRESIVVSSSRSLRSTLSPLEMRRILCLETSGTEYPVTQRHIAENGNLDTS